MNVCYHRLEQTGLNLRIFDTLTETKVEIPPSKEFRMFICGPTVQDNVHLGHAKTYLAFDLLARWLLRNRHKIFMLFNITDVDDKIFDRARKESSRYLVVADKFYKEFVEDLNDLNIVTVSKFARVSKYVEESAHLVQRLIDEEYAYPLDGSVFFDTSKAVNYGKLSHQTAFDLKFKQIDAAPGKKNAVDFLLWRKVSDAKEGVWHTSVGSGRPGWHIQDTAIALTELGEGYDLHGGATELIFPHHESELAQDEALTGVVPYVKIWMHTGLLLKGKEKMSKSLGNVIKIREALKRFSGDELRFHFLKHHYRDSYEIDMDALEESKKEFELILEVAKKVPRTSTNRQELEDAKAGEIWRKFASFLDDDLDSANALGVMTEVAKDLKKTDSVQMESQLSGVFWDMMETFGLRLV